MKPSKKFQNQITGNIGMYYVCFKLSERGWNVMPTARNAKGIDIVAYDDRKFIGIQVKTLSKRNPVPLGKNLDNVMGDYWCIVVRQKTGDPKVYVLKPSKILKLMHTSKDGIESHWLQPNAYESFQDDDLERIV